MYEERDVEVKSVERGGRRIIKKKTAGESIEEWRMKELMKEAEIRKEDEEWREKTRKRDETNVVKGRRVDIGGCGRIKRRQDVKRRRVGNIA